MSKPQQTRFDEGADRAPEPIRSAVSLIIVNWNSGPLLAKCLAHVARQSVRPEAIVVVDNASSDGSQEAARTSNDVDLIETGANLGFAAANNRALERCTSEFVALLNPDAFPEPDWLEALLRAAEENPRAAAFGSRQLQHENPHLLDGIGDAYHLSGLPWRQRFAQRQTSADLVGGEIFSPCAAAALYRRSAIRDVGGFDEDYFCYIEDVDLGFRLRLGGYEAIYVPDAVVHHVGSGTLGGDKSDFAVYHGHRNVVSTYVKNMPSPLLWLLLPLHIAMNIASLIWFSAKGRPGVIWRAKRDAIARLPCDWAKRRQIQAKRRVSIHELWAALDKSLIPSKAARAHELRREFRQ